MPKNPIFYIEKNTKMRLLITTLFVALFTCISYAQEKEKKLELNIAYYGRQTNHVTNTALGENQEFIGKFGGEYLLTATYSITPKYKFRFGVLYNRVYYQGRDYTPTSFCDSNSRSSYFATFFELNSIGLPLAFVYNYNLDERKDLYLVVGNILNVKRNHIYDSLFYECGNPKVLIPVFGEHFRKMNDEVYFGIGFKVKTFKATINIEPRIKYSITDITVDENIKEQIFSFGLLLGVNI